MLRVSHPSARVAFVDLCGVAEAPEPWQWSARAVRSARALAVPWHWSSHARFSPQHQHAVTSVLLCVARLRGRGPEMVVSETSPMQGANPDSAPTWLSRSLARVMPPPEVWLASIFGNGAWL